VHFFADEGLPLVRVGTLINSPLNTVIALDKSIKTPPICRAKSGLFGQRHRAGDAGDHGAACENRSKASS
jgi:hypothetical protein